MAKAGTFKEKWQAFLEKSGPVARKAGKVLKETARWIYKLRSIFLAIPVAFAAINFAIFNQRNLPELVGVDFQVTGEYAQIIQRSTAVMFPLGVTAVCLVLMFCSRRVLYPWLISIFSLVLPWLIYLTNVYPV